MISAGNMSDGYQKWFVWEASRFSTVAPLGVVYEDGYRRALAAAQTAFPGMDVQVWESK